MIRALLGMMTAAVVCVASMPLAGCARDTLSYSKARSAMERSDDAFTRIRKEAERALPFLSPLAADRVREGLAIANGAIGVARASVDDEDRALQLGRAAGAVAAIVAAIGGH